MLGEPWKPKYDIFGFVECELGLKEATERSRWAWGTCLLSTQQGCLRGCQRPWPLLFFRRLEKWTNALYIDRQNLQKVDFWRSKCSCSGTHHGWNVETMTLCGISLSQTVGSWGRRHCVPSLQSQPLVQCQAPSLMGASINHGLKKGTHEKKDQEDSSGAEVSKVYLV